MTSIHTSTRTLDNVVAVSDGEYSFDYLGETYFVETPPNPTLPELTDTLFRAIDFAAEHAAWVRNEIDHGYI